MIKDLVRKELAGLVNKTLGPGFTNFELEHPQNESFGDFTLNVAFKASKSLNQSPMEVAKRLSAAATGYSALFAKVEVVKPGFVNLTLKNEYLLEELKGIVQRANTYGSGEDFKAQKIMVEYTDPNPFKEFHVGHLYSNIVGESICRLLEFQGAKVWRVNYQGDVGLHVAKSLWGMKNLKAEMPNDQFSLKEKAAFMGRAYALGAKAYEEKAEAREAIIKLNKQVYERDPGVLPLWQKGRAWSQEYFELIYQRLGTNYGRSPAFNRYYPESEAGPIGLKLVEEGLKKGIFEKSQGAVVFKGESYGLHTRVFINSLGLPTYEAKELGLDPTKYKDFPYETAVVVTGNEIDDYFKVVVQALKLLNPELGEKTKHISHGMVRLPEGKMSSRTGKVIRGEWLLDEAAQKASKVVLEAIKGKSYDGEAGLGDLVEEIGVGAVKYAFLKGEAKRDIEFDFDESVSFEGKSGPYLQYTYARAKSVLRKAMAKGQGVEGKNSPVSQLSIVAGQLAGEELSLLRTLYRFPEVTQEAAQRFEPHLLCAFLFDLGQKFNLFYNNVQILPGNSSTPSQRLDPEAHQPKVGRTLAETTNWRLALTSATAQVLRNGLHLLGIATPEKM